MIWVAFGCAPEVPEPVTTTTVAESHDTAPLDADGDGYPGDCDDDDPAIHPGAEEVPYDGIDQDCDGVDADDLDGDGYVLAEDCDDDAAEIHPGAAETCDGVDQDCDGSVDEDAADAGTWYADADGDGYGDAGAEEQACESAGVTVAEDCDDADVTVHPGAEEACGNATDDNCDGYTDEMVAGVTHATVQEALDAACAELDTVWVSPGTYADNIVIARSLVLEAVDGPDTTILDGSACTRGVDACHVVEVTASDVTVRRLGITGGSAENGGGIYADYVGGLRVEDSVFEHNRVSSRGGGVYLNGNGTLTGNEFSDNEAGNGGGLYVRMASDRDGSSILVSANRIIGNLATSGGGGGYDKGTDDPATWDGNEVRDNTAVYGGGLMSEYTLVTSGNTITDNDASSEGGGLWYYREWIGSGDVLSGNLPEDVWDDGR